MKADVNLKTIRLTKNGALEQAISFPNFDFIETANQAWEDSAFYEKINQKFFFVIFQYDTEGMLRFKKCMFWNMPYEDRLEAERVWKKAARAIQSGEMNQLPKIKDSSVAHVRPHGRNKADVLPLPNGGSFTKQCFWLNQRYIKEQINR